MIIIATLYICGMALTTTAASVSPLGIVAMALVGFGCGFMARAAE